MKRAHDRGFLWRADKDGRTSYLYGTVHVGKREWTFPGPAVLKAVRAANVIALELDVLDPAQNRRVQEGMALRPEHHLPPALTERLRTQLLAACLPETMLGTLSPEMVAATLTVLSARKDGLDPAYAIDTLYAGMARAMGKPVESLETPELQLGLLLGSTDEETWQAVTSALLDLESGRAEPMLVRMAQIWSDGSLHDLEEYEKWCACVEEESDRVMMRRLLDERNPNLARGIDALHESGKTVFAAVGSLHMVGRLGLPALLAERGYRVQRIDFRQPPLVESRP